jgi:hypothetical protein
MLRVSIRATPETDVDAETANLRRAAEGAGLEAALVDRIVDEAQTAARDFVNRGRELKALGSHMKAERAISGDGYDIRVSFDTVQRSSSLLGRILAAFRR